MAEISAEKGQEYRMRRKIVAAGLAFILIAALAYYITTVQGSKNQKAEEVKTEDKNMENKKEESIEVQKMENGQEEAIENEKMENEQEKAIEYKETENNRNISIEAKEDQVQKEGQIKGPAENPNEKKESPQRETKNTDIDFEDMIEKIDNGIEKKIEKTLPDQDFDISIDESTLMSKYYRD